METMHSTARGAAVMEDVGKIPSSGREAYEAFCEALGNTTQRKDWGDLLPVERRAWNAAARVNASRADLAESLASLLRQEREALTAQVQSLRAQLRLAEGVRAAEDLVHTQLRRQHREVTARAAALLAELDGPGGFREHQQLTATVLEGALKGLPEASADLPHPVWASRAAAAIGRLRASDSTPSSKPVTSTGEYLPEVVPAPPTPPSVGEPESPGGMVFSLTRIE